MSDENTPTTTEPTAVATAPAAVDEAAHHAAELTEPAADRATAENTRVADEVTAAEPEPQYATPEPPGEAAAEPAAPEVHAGTPGQGEHGEADTGEPVGPAATADGIVAAPAEPAAESKKKWYVVKVQSGREESIRAAVERKVRIEGLEEFFGQIAIPVEQVTEVKKVTEKKNGERVTKEKRVIKDRKKFPGYLFAEVEFNDRILYLFRETSGVGDFVGATGPMKPPPPMNEREVQSMLSNLPSADGGKGPKGKVKLKLEIEKGDKVRVREGAFSGMEGEVKLVTEPKDADETAKVTVVVTVFGRPVDVTLDHWQVDKV